MTYLIRYLKLLLVTLLFFQCRKHDNRQFQQQTGDPLIVNEIECSDDTTQQYCIVLPERYDNQNAYPLIVVFDPHASGKLAAEKFMTAAADFGYIVAASSTIRNGYPSVEYALKILYDDLIKRYKINNERIYAAGFSGGGMVAQIFSQLNKNIKAIASMGAGYSLSDPAALNNRPSMLFLAGDEDFNYNEIVNSGKLLSHTNIYCYAYTYHGKHEWPENDIIREAILWFEFDAYRKDKKIIRKRVVHDYHTHIHQEIKTLQQQGNYIDAFNACERGIIFLSGLTGTAKLKKSLKAMKKHPEYIREVRKKEKASVLEMRLQQGYMAAFGTQDTLWWKKEIDGLNQQIASGSDEYMSPVYKRLKNFLSMIAYTYCNNALKENNLQKAAQYIAIYQMADPENADVYYFRALLSSKQGNNRLAAIFYLQAVKMGFSDFSKAKQEMPPSVFVLSEKQ